MVKTRSTTRKELESKEDENQEVQLQVQPQPTDGNTQKDKQTPTASQLYDVAGSSVKREYRLQQPPASRTGAKSTSTSSSLMARRKKLELEMAKEKAKIQMDLIDKQFQADLADLMDEKEEIYSPHSDPHDDTKNKKVEQWLEQSQLEHEPPLHAPEFGDQPGKQCPPAAPVAGPCDGTVHMLASALQNLSSISANNGTNNNLLSRMCTPRDLPSYSGDSLEWLQFKQAYDESTEVCGFSPKENLWRLRKCLHGPAKEAVSALMISGTSPDVVIKTLELLYGNADTILSKITQGLKKLPPMSNEYNKDIVSFSVKVQNFIAAVHAVGREEYMQGMHISNIILSKMPTVLISKWSDYSFAIIKEGKKSRLNILGDF
ncbi:unnamed protein product [Parnassius mnemosyne]|uniref:Uncharacterized protein n=1 Tax=Parnassius mnemosyne TaxID=213953 RepID=A0AAV1KDP7_9NEOP